MISVNLGGNNINYLHLGYQSFIAITVAIRYCYTPLILPSKIYLLREGAVNMKLSEILEGKKEGKTFWNTTRHLNAPEKALQVVEQLFGVRRLPY